MSYWLMKSEPDVFSIDDLSKRPCQTEPWNGVRNYQARNMLRDEMKLGDLAFFYHSSCKIPGIIGIVEIVREGYPDETAWDPKSPYYDPNSTENNPRWFQVDVKFKKKFPSLISLEQLKKISTLKKMRLLQKGNRLSIMPIQKKEWDDILNLLFNPMTK